MLQNSVPELYPLRYKDLPIPIYICDTFSKLVREAYKIRTSSAIIWNTMDCLEPSSLSHIQQQFQVPILPLGPMHKFAPASSSNLWKEDTSCIEWLGKQVKNSVIYVSLGSIACMDEKHLTELAWGLASSQQPFLWVIRPGSVRGSEWIEVLPEGFKENIGERGCIVTWAPQKEVLAHNAVGGFLSHCGWNSTLESISEGIPMICRPCFGDQRVNTRYVSQIWKIGVELENEMERGEIKRAVRRIMVEKEGEAMRERAKNLKESVELCTKEGGSSNNALKRLVEMIMS